MTNNLVIIQTQTQSSDSVDNLRLDAGMGLLHWLVVYDTVTRSSTKHDTSAAIIGQMNWNEKTLQFMNVATTVIDCTLQIKALCINEIHNVWTTWLLKCWIFCVKICVSNTLNLCPALKVSDQVSHPWNTTGKTVILYILIFIFLDKRRLTCATWWKKRVR